MRLTVSQDHAGRPALLVEGDVDLAVADELRTTGCDTVAANPGWPLHIDLSEVTFMDSTGLGALVAINTAAAVDSGSVVLVGPTPRVLRLLELTALDQIFTIDNADRPSGAAESFSPLDGPAQPV
jgi:anti-sigma B factor antagonist